MEINAKVIADSISTETGTRIMTFELEYHRFIHAEFMTHRVFSRNAASSRAIPVAKMLEMVRTDPAAPIFFGKNRAGMQAVEEVDSPDECLDVWRTMAKMTADGVEKLTALGLHKQHANRPLEPYQFIKVVMTTTDFANWDWLRDHGDAQPEIQALARVISYWKGKSKPKRIDYGEWHMPYVKWKRDDYGFQVFYDEKDSPISVKEALMISSSCCAQVSYRKLDGTLEKAEDIYKKLIESKPCHASPTEHQATPIDPDNKLEKGVTHIQLRDGAACSGNFRWWIQHRQLIEGHTQYD